MNTLFEVNIYIFLHPYV